MTRIMFLLHRLVRLSLQNQLIPVSRQPRSNYGWVAAENTSAVTLSLMNYSLVRMVYLLAILPAIGLMFIMLLQWGNVP